MFDSHCHLDSERFSADERDSLLDRALAAGVTDILIPAVRPSDWPALARRCRDARDGVRPGPRLHLALGIHPQIVPLLTDDERRTPERLAEALAAAGAVAVGECGLDGGTADQAEQERLFRAQIGVAREQRLPLVVHVLRAHDAAPRILAEERAGEVGGVLHSYSGGEALVPVYRDLGFHFSFAGPVSYANSRRPAAAAAAVPAELLLAETDAPDQTPEPHRGERNQPAYLPHVIDGLARARGADPAAVAALTAANARRLFRVP